MSIDIINLDTWGIMFADSALARWDTISVPVVGKVLNGRLHLGNVLDLGWGEVGRYELFHSAVRFKVLSKPHEDGSQVECF